jgi:phosphopantothenoylcysteine synthetase/decarboxylase
MPVAQNRRVVVTCGPASAPIDAVRCISNFSTGELGAVLAGHLAEAGFEVLCLKGVGATARFDGGFAIREFRTNADLAALLKEAAGGAGEPPCAVLHAAALSDFEVCREGMPRVGKLRSDSEGLSLRLRPAEKVLPKLRGWFPRACLVGWKFEVDGSMDNARRRAMAQLASCATDLCVLNGPAAGPGFTVIAPDATSLHLPDKRSLASDLTRRVMRKQETLAACRT